MVYIEQVEKFPATLNIGNVYAAGSQDTRLSEAKLRAETLFKSKPKPPEDTEVTLKFNGKDSLNADKCCYTFNLGKSSAKHPAKHLHPDGTCRFRHACNQWVSGKGKGGICEGNHPRSECTNPGKVDKPADA